jgi:predicted DsbA family dithiol-disulfide isomerase
MVTVHVWSDVVCPWCYLGKRRLEAAVEAFGAPVETIWHSFELDPRRMAEKQTASSAAERLAKKYGMPLERAVLMMDQMEERGRAEGIEFSLQGGKTLQSFDAHRLLHFAATENRQPELVERIFRAHFTEALDVGSWDVLAGLSHDVGLDPEQAKLVLESGQYGDVVRKDESTAREMGVTGVPFFVMGSYGVAGAQSSDVLLDVLRQAESASHP